MMGKIERRIDKEGVDGWWLFENTMEDAKKRAALCRELAGSKPSKSHVRRKASRR
jgi:hypothetical protein